MLHALEVAATVVVGVMVGVEFSVAAFVNPVLDRLPGDGGLHGRAHGGRLLGTVMPVWYVAALVLVAARVLAGWHRPGTGLVVAAAALLVAGVLLSVLLLVPINNRVRTWTAASRPADWRRQTARWDRYHRVRVAAILAAFTLLAAGLVPTGG